MSRSTSRLLSAVALGGVLALQAACEPMPDYRLVVRNIPAGTQALVVGALLEGDVVAKAYQAIPVRGLDDAGLASFTIGLATRDSESKTAILSVGTVDGSGCLTSVASSTKITRSSALNASTTEIQLSPCLNPDVQLLAAGYDSPAQCPKLPALDVARLTEAIELPTYPVIIQTRRLIASTDGVLESTFTAHGWGMDRGALNIAIDPVSDKTGCQADLRRTVMMANLPPASKAGLLALIDNIFAINPAQKDPPSPFPAYTLTSFARVDMIFRTTDQPMTSTLPPDLLTKLVQCFATTTQIYTKANPGGRQVTFREVNPTEAMMAQRRQKIEASCPAACGATSCP